MALFCSDCGSELTSQARFCASCGASVSSACVSCGAELSSGAAFCQSCGAAQGEAATGQAGPEELRVVSCLFADLAGFTSHTERSDPEDVRARLAVYHRKVREDVERWGGTIEKLMGDGVFAVFGVPAIHEDDPERAVRAALRIQQSVDEINAADPALDLAVRIGVATGEAIVQLDARDQNERIIGDVVNTASRLEGTAHKGGVVIDERTYLAVRSVIECDPLDPVQVKGKAGPLAVWRAREARSRYGVAIAEDEVAEFVGRREELSLLVDALERTIARRTSQLVTITGEPGVGKSRLVREFWAAVDDRPDIVVRWRQGRSLPYGEGVAFWALSEIVKSEAGILESEPPDEARAKLHASIDNFAEGRDDVDVSWLRQRLAPLAGAGGSEGIDRAELFSAWLQYLELIAAKDPLVMVIEDFHWADDALADFLEHVLDWAQDAPVLIVCTARSEWFTRRPDWGGGKREGATIGLEPLTGEETAHLVATLTHRSVMPAEIQQTLLDRSGGNPLYLIEYVRLAEEKGWFDEATSPDDIPLPDSVQAIIAARLDLLEPDDRSLLQAAAVVGRVFWTGALSFLRDADTDEVRDALRRLARRELLRPVRHSSMQGQEEFIFIHVLARDVAYGQLTRSEKARLHRETARWLEAVSGGRAIDVAELLAHHHTTALALEPSDDPDLLNRVYRFLMLAAERTESLDVQAADRFALRAADVATNPTDRGRALTAVGKSLASSREESYASLTEAIELFAGTGDDLARAEALKWRSRLEWWAGNKQASDVDMNTSVELIEGMPNNAVVAEIFTHRAAMLQLGGHEEEALDVVEQALAAASEIGDVRARARALRIRGSALIQLGDSSGEADVLESLRIDLDLGNTREAVSDYNNQATFLGSIGRAEEAREMIDEAIAYGTQRGASAGVEWSKMTKCESSIQLGELSEVEALADELIEADAARGGSQVGLFARAWRATVLWARGEAEAAWEIGHEALSKAREIGDPQVLMPALSWMIVFSDSASHLDFAEELVPEFVEFGSAHPGFLVGGLSATAPTLIKLGLTDELQMLLDRTDTVNGEWVQASVDSVRALIDEAHGDARAALDKLLPAIEVGDGLKLKFHTTRLRIDAARCATALGENQLARDLLATARQHADEMGMRIALDQIDNIEEAGAAAG